MPRRAGILVVRSRLTDPNAAADLDRLYVKWYTDVHLPDMAALEGVRAASFYVVDPSKVREVQRPYLAVYHVDDVAPFQDGSALRSVSLHSDLLPVPSRLVLDVADFDSKLYVLVGEGSGSPVTIEERFKHLEVVDFASDKPLEEEAEACALSLPGGPRPDKSCLYTFHSLPGIPGRETWSEGSSDAIQHLVLHYFEQGPERAGLCSHGGVRTAFLLKAWVDGLGASQILRGIV